MNPVDPPTAPSPADPMSRRGVLRLGGITVSLAAVVAACGRPEEGAPGRVGNAPEPTDLPSVTVDDGVLLRTATSLEYSAVSVYERIKEYGTLDGTAAALVDRMIEDHTRHAASLADLTTDAGAEAYECANSWYASRVIEPMFERIDGNAEDDPAIEPSDDVARDLVGIAHGFESMLGSMYQQFVEHFTTPELRQEAMTAAAEEVRHAAALAIARGGEEGYVSPTLWGEQVDVAASDGVIPLFAIPGRFGSLAPVELTLGPLNDAGTRFTTSVATPADNSYVYTDQTC